MSSPAFVHLRLHSEFSIVDGTLRIDEAIGAAVADAMPALAITDLANTFGLVKFYKAARSAGVKPVLGCDVWLTHEAERDQPFRALLLVAVARWLSQAHRLADSRISRQCVSRPRRDEAGVVRRRHRRPDRAVRRPRRRHRPCAAAGQPRRRDQSRARVGGALSGSLLSRGAARRSRRRRRACRGDGRAREGADAPRRRDASGPVPATGRVPGARGARVHRRGPCARRSAPPEALHAGSVFQDAGGDDRGLFRSSAKRSPIR